MKRDVPTIMLGVVFALVSCADAKSSDQADQTDSDFTGKPRDTKDAGSPMPDASAPVIEDLPVDEDAGVPSRDASSEIIEDIDGGDDVDAAIIAWDTGVPVGVGADTGASSDAAADAALEECQHDCRGSDSEQLCQSVEYDATRARLMGPDVCAGQGAYGGHCADGTLFLVEISNGFVAWFFDSSGSFLGLTELTDDVRAGCPAYYWPDPIACPDAVVDEVFCGDNAAPGQEVVFPFAD